MTHQVGIYLFDAVEVLDFAGPFEVFTTAARVRARAQPGAPPCFEVVTIAAAHLVKARGALRVQPHCTLDDHPPLDVLIIPGGVVDAEVKREAVIDWIRGAAASAEITASVCTGAFLLAQAGLLKGRRATTHWEDIPALRAAYPGVEALEGHPWVDEGPVVTAAGISAGIGMSLHLVERLEGRELALKTARQMEYNWST